MALAQSWLDHAIPRALLCSRDLLTRAMCAAGYLRISSDQSCCAADHFHRRLLQPNLGYESKSSEAESLKPLPIVLLDEPRLQTPEVLGKILLGDNSSPSYFPCHLNLQRPMQRCHRLPQRSVARSSLGRPQVVNVRFLAE